MTSILLVDDERQFVRTTAEILAEEGYSTATAESLAEARVRFSESEFDVLLVDLMLPDGNGLELLEELGDKRPRLVIIVTGQPGIKSVVRELHGPGLEYLIKPIDITDLTLRLGRIDVTATPAAPGAGKLVGDSEAMQLVNEQIRQVAGTDTSVLISGESGTGKELVAEAIHQLSGRSGQFLPVNCGALTRDLLTSELFGHERGSFTGASKRHQGVFERADGGTLFLDEITEMPIDQQPHLLRALETNRITRVGGDKEIPFTARIVAASNRDLIAAIEDATFREDLYFRLSIFPIELPPLRKRTGDVSLLARTFLAQLNSKYGTQKFLPDETLERLESWHWPGNVRELKHTLHRFFIRTSDNDGAISLPTDFSLDVNNGTARRSLEGRKISDVEQELIQSTLEHFKGDKRASAESLGISLKTLYNRLREYGVDT